MKRPASCAIVLFFLSVGPWGPGHELYAQTVDGALSDSATPVADAFPATDSVGSDGGSAALPDAPMPVAASADLPDAPTPVASYEEKPEHVAVERETTLKSFLPDVLYDQKEVWLSPRHLNQGRAWIPLAIVAVGTAGFIVSDSHVMPYFRDHQRNLDDVNDAFDTWITSGEVAAVPLGLFAAAAVRGDSYETSTALLAARGYADTEILEFVAKLVSRRERPSQVPAGQNFNHTFFKSQVVSLSGSSFPSGHAAGAFCIASIVSTRYYRNHHWVPYLLYGMATAISLSRITTLGHYPSDVFAGAAMGFAVSRLQVMHQPR
jgi:membrane-associated phospholipid phosphatase